MSHLFLSIMRSLLFSGCIIASVFGSESGHGSFEKMPQPKTKVSSPLLHGVIFFPYHAEYAITLDKNCSHDEGIKNVSGKIIMDVKDLGDRWEVVYSSTLYVYCEGKEKADQYHFTSTDVEWKNSQKYTFEWTSRTDDPSDETTAKGRMIPFDGEDTLETSTTETMIHTDMNGKTEDDIATEKVESDAHLGHIHKTHNIKHRFIQYDAPNDTRVPLHPDVKLPMQHLMYLIQKALRSKSPTESSEDLVFDGSNDTPRVVSIESIINPYTTVIKPNLVHSDESFDGTTEAGRLAKKRAEDFAESMRKAKAWTIKMNVYPSNSEDREDGEPDYVQEYTVNEMGMVLGMKIHYLDPDFVINAEISDCHSLSS